MDWSPSAPSLRHRPSLDSLAASSTLHDSQSKSCAPGQNSEFWLHDGSIVLAVQDTLFRVHQTILANHSEVFSDMFSMPQPPEEEPSEGKLEGCPVVHLQDDPSDFVDLLRAIYYPSHFNMLPPSADLDTLLTFISGILRLSTKYLLRELRNRCIAMLTSHFPTTYQDYLTKQSSRSHHHTSPRTSIATVTPPSSGSPPMPTTKERHKPSAIMRAMNLAQETNVPLVLPYAFYLLARTSTPRRFLAHADPPDSISWHQKAICLVGREILRNAEMSLTHSFLFAFQPSLRCLTPAFCGNARSPHAEWHNLIDGDGSGSNSSKKRGRGPNPLRAYDRWDKMNVCMECVKDSKRSHESGREEVWGRLPEFFELNSWAELRAAQER